MERSELHLAVEVAYATRERQVLFKVAVPRGGTIQDAIERAVSAGLTVTDMARCKVGVFGRVLARDTPVRDGDRVEIYRPLMADPKDARRARSGKKAR